MKKLVTLLLAVLMVVTLSGCGSKEEEPKTIVIGGSGPLTGGAAAYGLSVRNSAQIAVDEINALGGLQFTLEFEDDTHDAEKAVNAFGVLQDKKQKVSLLTTTSAPGTAVAPLTNEENIFAITPSGSSPSVTLANVTDQNSYYGNVFQMCFSDPNQGAASATYIKEKGLASNVGIIFKSDDTYSTGIVAKFESKADELGLKYVECGSFETATATDFSAQVKAAKDAGCDLVFLPIYYDAASLILTEAKKQAFETIFFGVDGMDGILSQENFDTTLAEGVYLLTPFDKSATDEKTQNYVKKYIEAYGEDTLLQFGADAYDCVYAIYQACTEGGVTYDMSASEICEILKAQFTSMTFSGLTGECVWNADGTVNKSPKAVIITNGAYKMVD